MSTSAVASETPLVAPPRKRAGRFPLIVLGVTTILVTILWLLPQDSALRGLAVTGTVLLGLLAGLLVGVWFVFFSGFGWRLRVATVLALAVAGVAFAGSLRTVEFTGDMVPEFVFRWQPERAVMLETHRAGQRATAGRIAPDDLSLAPGDSAEYRGPRRDGVVVGPPLVRSWPDEAPPAPLWRQPVGGGYAAFAVVGHTAYTIEQRRGNEAVVAYDTRTGQERWVHEYPALFTETAGGPGPRATPTFHDGRLYSLGATGELVCLDAASGERLWRVNILELNGGATNIIWGMCGSPLVVGDTLFVSPGAQGPEGTAGRAAVLALDARSGSLRWTGGDTNGSYTSPMLVTLGGTAQVVVFDAAGVAGYSPDAGQRLWLYEWTTLNDINASQPLVLPGDRLFVTSELGGAVIEISPPAADAPAWQVREVWQSNTMKCSYANPVHREGYIYGLDRGILGCVSAETGARAWKSGRYGHGQVLLSDDLVVVLGEQGELALVEATPDEFRELARFQALTGKTWNNPVLVDGRLYARNHIEMACYDLRAGEK